MEFSAIGIISFKLTLKFKSIIARARARAIALPAMSFFINNIDELGLRSKPPLSKVIPLPIITIFGADKQKVGMVAAKIKSLRPPEPYKGKGIKEQGQYILRKEGKKK